MNENLISETNTEVLLNFMGEELYLVKEAKIYDEINSLGGYKNHFINIINHQNIDFLNDEQRSFFFKMAAAIKNDKIQGMNADDFAIINYANYDGLTWENISKIFNPKYCIFWGINPIEFQMPCGLYKGINHQDCRIIYVDAMDTIMGDIELKKKLWSLVKRMFDMPQK